jgi:photosystem II stability/assembly factor-like uncharacterized protein
MMKRRVSLAILAIVLVGLAYAVVASSGCGSQHYFSTTTELMGVAFPDRDHAWVVDDGPTIRASTDGGSSWTEQKSGGQWTPWAVAFANAKQGWVVGATTLDINGKPLGGDVNIILATTDGGATWKQQPSGTDSELDDVACVDATHAWAVGGIPADGVILATTDSGASWKRQLLSNKGGLEAVAFADRRHGWAVGWSLIVGTTDGGVTWRTQISAAHYRFFDVAGAGTEHAWAIGVDDSDNRSVILGTTDGGEKWKLLYSTSDVVLSSVAFADAVHGWVVGSGGTILATTDGGRSWRRQPSGTTIGLNHVAFADTTHGMVTGNKIEGDDPIAGKLDGSILLRTTDGGATWQR